MIRTFSGRKIELEIVRLNSLIPHEQTIPVLLESVTRDFARTGYQRDPLLVDKRSMIVLDGMHRRAALEALGAKYALCALFDYLNKDISVDRWLRYFVAPDREMLDEVIEIFDLEKAADYHFAMEMVDSMKTSIALLSNRHSFVSKENYDIQTLYRKLEDFDRIASSRGIEVEFHAEENQNSMFSSESVFVLYPRSFEKEDILRIAESHRLFPYKTTRHLVPVRPMGIYFPLELLRHDDLEACQMKLKEIVSQSKVTFFEKDTWYEGRRYSEILAVFNRDLNRKQDF